MADSELVINKGTARKPDFWLLSKDKFSDEELAEVEPVMRKLKIQRIPMDTPIRWGELHSKEAVLAALRKQLPAKKSARR